MALQFDIHILRAVDPDQPVHDATACLFAAAGERGSQRAFVATGQTDESIGKLL